MMRKDATKRAGVKGFALALLLCGFVSDTIKVCVPERDVGVMAQVDFILGIYAVNKGNQGA